MAITSGLKILIVDDDFQNREILKARLEQAGHQIFEASNGDEGVRVAMGKDFNLILLDIMMPGKDGWQVCKAIKSHPKTKHIPIIVQTARVQPIDEMRTWECGADDFIEKPVDHKKLFEIISRLTSMPLGEEIS